ncbi:MAG: hypothetical protein IPP14_14550 [Planctomycetes bacterium]|nr:hypothetical protein [Planctomycetota bacterium]
MKTEPEPAFAYFSHARRALGALALTALGALVMIGLIPLLAGRTSGNKVDQPAASTATTPPAGATATAWSTDKPR